jgi:hypothetical protein
LKARCLCFIGILFGSKEFFDIEEQARSDEGNIEECGADQTRKRELGVLRTCPFVATAERNHEPTGQSVNNTPDNQFSTNANRLPEL